MEGPKQFYVRYGDNEELLKLVFLLQKHGYENIHNIDFSLFDEKPYVLCVDNQDMSYWPTSITCCACASSAGKKFYDYKVFEEMLERIFGEKNENNI